MTDRPIRAVFFDMDETLIVHGKSFEDIARDTYAAFAGRLGPVTSDAFWEAFWPRAVDLWYMMFDGVLEGPAAREYSYRNTLRALKADESLAPAMVDYGDDALAACTTLVDGAIETLIELREAGLILGMVTNGYIPTQRRKIARHGLDAYLDPIVISEEANAHKPDPRVFRYALEKAGVSAEESVFVGDMPENDIQGALGVGMAAVHIDVQGKWAHLRDAQTAIVPSHRITRLPELIPLLGL